MKHNEFPDILRLIEKHSVTRSLIKLFYEAVASGSYRLKPEKKRVIESKINAAVKAGKVLNA